MHRSEAPRFTATAFVPLIFDTPNRSRRRSDDLAVVVIVAALATAAALCGFPALLRVALGLPFIVFLPGYALVAALFPTTGSVDGVERLALGFGLSLAVIPLVALALSFSPWRITLASILVSVSGVIVVLVLVALYRRTHAGAQMAFDCAFRLPSVPRWKGWPTATLVSTGVLIVSIGLLLIAAVPLLGGRATDQHMSEFALYNAEGKAEFYPRAITVGQASPVRLSITNREGKHVAYRITVAGDGVATSLPQLITLAANDTWTGTVAFTVPHVGDGQAVLFYLWRQDTSQGTPYRTLRLIVDGIAPGSDGTASGSD